MRRIEKEELKQLSKFMVEQFWEQEQMQKMFNGIQQEKAKAIAVNLGYFDIEYFFKYGDIFIYDNDITGAIVGIEYKKLSLIKELPYVFKGSKVLRQLSKEDRNKIKQNSKQINKVHNRKWSEKYCKEPYYILQFGIDKNKRGNGIAREMLQYLFDFVKEKNIVLETLTSSNIPIYQHFGFEVKEFFESGEFKEFRMIKSL